MAQSYTAIVAQSIRRRVSKPKTTRTIAFRFVLAAGEIIFPSRGGFDSGKALMRVQISVTEPMAR
jgi:hypothetical protein